eukprot:COSAG05_NODE_1470_length_4792_cov_101.589815_3_plen_278_part_00
MGPAQQAELHMADPPTAGHPVAAIPVCGPEHIGELIEVLVACLSPDGSVRQPAEDVLGRWKDRQGYLMLLMEVIVLRGAPLEARWLAACCFKNDIRRSWRRSRQMTGGVTPVEKSHLRCNLLSMADLTVDVEQISKQVAEIVALVARFEFPSGWPELLPALVARLDLYAVAGSDGLVGARTFVRTLYVFTPSVLLPGSCVANHGVFAPIPTIDRLCRYAVLKQLATKRLTADRLAFAALSEQLFPKLHLVWQAQSDALIRGGVYPEFCVSRIGTISC